MSSEDSDIVIITTDDEEQLENDQKPQQQQQQQTDDKSLVVVEQQLRDQQQQTDDKSLVVVEQRPIRIEDKRYYDERINQSYLLKDEVKRIIYYESQTKTTFKINKDDDLIDGHPDRIYLNIMSPKAQKQFDSIREGIIRVKNQKNQFIHGAKYEKKFELKDELEVNEEVLIKKERNSRLWQHAKVIDFKKDERVVVIELLNERSNERYQMNRKTTNDHSNNLRLTVPFNSVAYFVPPHLLLTKACRVVAKFVTENNQVNFITGQILDLAKKANKNRFLVFLEGDLVRYVAEKDIAIIFDQSKFYGNFSLFQKEFIQYFFKSFPYVPLAKFKKDETSVIRIRMPNQSDYQYVQTNAVVTDVDDKLVQFYSKAYDTYVWLFRGDFTRIQTIAKPQMNRSINRQRPIRKVGTQQQKPIEIIIDDEENDDQITQSDIDQLQIVEQPLPTTNECKKTVEPAVVEPIARTTVTRINLNEIIEHQCSSACLSPDERKNLVRRGINMYILPLLFGWKRSYQIKFDHRKQIFYITPCGYKIFDIEEIFDYLMITESKLQIDMFNLDRNFVIEEEELENNQYYELKEDISNGVELQTISMINTIDKSSVPDFDYINERIFHDDIKIDEITNLNFMVCCSCDDNCRDPNKCACQKLTKQAFEPVDELNEFPIKNRILSQKILSGLYECNDNCACLKRKDQCVNRNAQLGLRNKLQLFKTIDKGWAVRTLHDIPKGAFICTYAGIVVDDKTAEEHGLKYSDAYLADLDLIENLEDAKINGFFELGSNDGYNASNEQNFRSFFGEENPYTIDGNQRGNIGRFLNHSCEPNCFPQTVFVDTHDLRFPWLTFYSNRHIPAYTELTWDYSYEIPDNLDRKKRIDCNCRSEKCRIRLL